MEIVEKTVKGKNSAVKKDTKIATKSTAATLTQTSVVERTKTTTTVETNVVTTTTTTITATERVEPVFDAANSKSTVAIASTVTPIVKTKETSLLRSNIDKTNIMNDPSMIIETISISDGEESPPPKPTAAEIGSKKRKSVGAKAEDEEHLRFVKHRKIKVAGAPKMPLSGYMRYMNDRREILKKEQPGKTAMDLTKMIAEEWNQLAEERKEPYIKSAEVDKQRYLSELQIFLKARPDVLACELAKNKPRKSAGSSTEGTSGGAKSSFKDKQQPTNGKDLGATKQAVKDDLAKSAGSINARPIMHTRRLSVNYTMPTYVVNDSSPPDASAMEKIKTKTVENIAATDASPPNPIAQIKRKRTPTPTLSYNISNNNHNSGSNTNLAAALSAPTPGEIPIFTNEFLEHNKTFDMELRTLRKSKADLEQQNAVLEKHVENMKFGVEKMANENDELQEKNRLLEIYLDKLKRKLATALSGLSIPSEPQGATVENIDKYMNDLYKMSTSNTHGPASLNKAKDIIRKLDLQIQL